MEVKWYYSEESSPDEQTVDEFADSKFTIDKWRSFTREIIQNSLDVHDDDKPNEPVEVVFELNKDLTLNQIPGGERVKEILSICQKKATNPQTIGRYKRGLEVLSKEKVYCLKVSDRNTIGVETGRSKSWGALVFDDGNSIKRPGSAGSHGVGKKVPFIISSCNTVYYATKNKYKQGNDVKSDCLFQGKTVLINWEDEKGIRRNKKGWLGEIDPEAKDPKEIVKPVNAEECDFINPFFLRTDDYGTDVIILGVNLYEVEDQVKKEIIASVLENFFVAIKEKKLTVNVFGENINAGNLEEIANEFYEESSDTRNNLFDCLRVYNHPPKDEKDIFDRSGNIIGKIKIYFGLGNAHNKKYYTVVRSHGMRIVDYRINRAYQPYTAVIYVEGEELNKKLHSLENTAHDTFVTKDENMEINEEAVFALNEIQDKIADYVIENTKIDDTEGQEIDGLSNIITIPGIISSVRRNNSSPSITRHKTSRRGLGKQGKDYSEGRTGAGGLKRKRRRKGKGMNKPAITGDEFDSILFEDYAAEPVLIKRNMSYELKLSTNVDVKEGTISIFSINSDGKQDSSIYDYVDTVIIDGQQRKLDNGKIKNVRIKKNDKFTALIKLKKDVIYQLSANLFVKEEENEQVSVSGSDSD